MKTILIVEDDPTISDLIADLLSPTYRVIGRIRERKRSGCFGMNVRI